MFGGIIKSAARHRMLEIGDGNIRVVISITVKHGSQTAARVEDKTGAAC